MSGLVITREMPANSAGRKWIGSVLIAWWVILRLIGLARTSGTSLKPD